VVYLWLLGPLDSSICLAAVLCVDTHLLDALSLSTLKGTILLLRKPAAELAGVTLDEQASKVIILPFTLC